MAGNKGLNLKKNNSQETDFRASGGIQTSANKRLQTHVLERGHWYRQNNPIIYNIVTICVHITKLSNFSYKYIQNT
jgi:hypothetical protein